jgi:two-component system, NarL family, response regulator DevR
MPVLSVTTQEKTARAEEPQTTAVFLLVENRLLRDALAKLLDKKNDLEIVGACAFSALWLEQLVRVAPDVIIIDSFTSTVHGEFLRQLRDELQSLKIVMIGMEADEQSFLHSVQEGALGYLVKDASAAEIAAAVRAVANGEAVCPPPLCTSLFRYVARQRQQLPSFQVKVSLGLTNREQQLVLLIGRGMTNKEIASQLCLAEQTVRNHVHRMLRKVGANNRLAVVEMCRMHGLPV